MANSQGLDMPNPTLQGESITGCDWAVSGITKNPKSSSHTERVRTTTSLLQRACISHCLCACECVWACVLYGSGFNGWCVCVSGTSLFRWGDDDVAPAEKSFNNSFACLCLLLGAALAKKGS